MYGYELAKTVRETCKGTFELKVGTLYLSLKRLEKNEYVQSYWGDVEESGGGRRKYYRITNSGAQYLKNKKLEWEFMKFIMDSFLGGVNGSEK
jgi:PadR family transcriptional regulator PadR